MKSLALFWTFSLLFFCVTAAQAETFNAGLVSGIWYSKTPFFAGETVRMYTAVHNNSGSDIVGKVRFLTNNAPIGEMAFSAPEGGLVQAWIDWKVHGGNSKIEAEMVDVKRLEVGKNPEPIVLTSPLVAQDEISVDTDTDQDQIGNLQDTDDDNDGLSDEKERALGTDPLKPDAPKSVVPKTTFENKYLAAVEQKTDELVGTVVEKLKAQKEEVGGKKQSKESSTPVFAGAVKKINEALPLFNIPEEKVPTKNELENFLLASAITAFPQWRLVVLIIGVVILFKLIRRFFF